MHARASLLLDPSEERAGLSRCFSNCPKLFGFELPKEIKVLFNPPLPEAQWNSVLFSIQILKLPKEYILKFFQSMLSKSFKFIFFSSFYQKLMSLQPMTTYWRLRAALRLDFFRHLLSNLNISSVYLPIGPKR